jgi:ABC-type antimicrobial peptide transport system permease subunit
MSLDPNAPPHAAMSCEDYVRSAFTVPRVAVTLLSFLGLVAMLLAVMGMYAVISHNVGQRLREFGVRMALGAQPGNISWLVLRQGLRLVAVGIGLGAVIGFAINLLIAGILVGVSATDLTTWLVVPLVLVAAVLAACWFPVRRAVRSQPLLALRCE